MLIPNHNIWEWTDNRSKANVAIKKRGEDVGKTLYVGIGKQNPNEYFFIKTNHLSLFMRVLDKCCFSKYCSNNISVPKSLCRQDALLEISLVCPSLVCELQK